MAYTSFYSWLTGKEGTKSESGKVELSGNVNYGQNGEISGGVSGGYTGESGSVSGNVNYGQNDGISGGVGGSYEGDGWSASGNVNYGQNDGISGGVGGSYEGDGWSASGNVNYGQNDGISGGVGGSYGGDGWSASGNINYGQNGGINASVGVSNDFAKVTIGAKGNVDASIQITDNFGLKFGLGNGFKGANFSVTLRGNFLPFTQQALNLNIPGGTMTLPIMVPADILTDLAKPVVMDATVGKMAYMDYLTSGYDDDGFKRRMQDYLNKENGLVTAEEYLLSAMRQAKINGDEEALSRLLDMYNNLKLKNDLEGQLTKAETARYDPIVIDLNKNSKISSENKAYFDLDNDGFAEKSEWIEKEDGFLVRDIDNNGKIDNISELIGDKQLLSNGELSKNGLEVLKDMDTNKDGYLDANDDGFSSLKVWIDSNGNGLTDEGELKTLEELDIKRFNLNESISKDFIIGSTEFNDGSTTQIGDLFFDADEADTIDMNKVEVSDEIALMPNIHLGGKVFDLQKAMELDSTLKSMIENFVINPSLDSYFKIDDILYRWCFGTENIDSDSRGGNIDARMLGVIEKVMGEPFVFTNSSPNPSAASILKNMYNQIRDYVFCQLVQEVFAYEFFGIGFDSETGDLLNCLGKKVGYRDYIVYSLYIKSVEMSGGYNEDYKLMYEEVFSKLKEGSEVFNCFTKMEYVAEVSSLQDSTKDNYIIANSENNSICGGDRKDVIYGGAGNDMIYGKDGNDKLYGGAGDDKLYGGNGDDYLEGGAGDDYLSGGAGDDTFVYGKGYGNDIVTKDWSSTQEQGTLIMKDLNKEDIEYGAKGDDLILKIKETGETVTIKNYLYYDRYKMGKIEFEDGTVLFEDIVNTIKENPVLIEGTENNDSINYSGSASKWMRVNVKAGSGNDTIYTGIEDDYIEGGAGNDYINSGSGNDEVYGGEGNDTIYGENGNDKLYGGAGDDKLYGGNGDDYLEGGAGNDYLEGSYGSDTYIYNKGDGNDTIYDYSTVAGEIDKLILNDINSSDVSLSKEGYNLVLSINGTEDKITVSDHYYSSNYRLENITFADGVSVSCDNTGSFDVEGAVAMLKQTYCLTSEDEAIINTSNINTETNTDESSFVAFLNTNEQ